ncbi:galactose mutarotase [Marinilongibacter aquaticus]|uniref:aldose epimerase family protein n=1 Tax=Marinilongibacter aquaticus TaxID=2975157 RepID=UPI0021BDB57A|nr:aldose epimerase family protein [Marinilongibacter aquaticus]UBM58142.1 galactose mutarotase [Marinilongibacter aquaticus]
MRKILLAVCATGALWACSQKNESKMNNQVASISEQIWGQMPDSTDVSLFTLKNAAGVTVTITNFGGRIVEWKTPDREGNFENINLAMPNCEDYVEGRGGVFGALIGRFGNRIANAKFTLDGTEYHLVANNGPNSLHGSGAGPNNLLWDAEIIDAVDPTLQLKVTLPDGGGGFPGNMDITVTYTLDNDNGLRIDYEAVSDKPTVVNLTNHSYFNLSGLKRDVMDHEVKFYADKYLPVDQYLIPLGAPESVVGTPFDFLEPHTIGERIDDSTNVQLTTPKPNGYDHAMVFSDSSNALKLGAEVYEPASGRLMEVYTTEPAVHFYTPNFPKDLIVGIDSVKYEGRWAFCLETEHYPDSPNHPEYPSTTLRPGETYKSTTLYKLSVRD